MQPKIMAYKNILNWKFNACFPCLSTNSDLSLLIVHNTKGPTMFPKGKKNLEKVDKWINVAMFFRLLSVVIFKTYNSFLCKYISKRRYYAIQSTIINIFLTIDSVLILFNFRKNINQ